jgi:hypothetical protein
MPGASAGRGAGDDRGASGGGGGGVGGASDFSGGTVVDSLFVVPREKTQCSQRQESAAAGCAGTAAGSGATGAAGSADAAGTAGAAAAADSGAAGTGEAGSMDSAGTVGTTGSGGTAGAADVKQWWCLKDLRSNGNLQNIEPETSHKGRHGGGHERGIVPHDSRKSAFGRKTLPARTELTQTDSKSGMQA